MPCMEGFGATQMSLGIQGQPISASVSNFSVHAFHAPQSNVLAQELPGLSLQCASRRRELGSLGCATPSTPHSLPPWQVFSRPFHSHQFSSRWGKQAEVQARSSPSWHNAHITADSFLASWGRDTPCVFPTGQKWLCGCPWVLGSSACGCRSCRV